MLSKIGHALPAKISNLQFTPVARCFGIMDRECVPRDEKFYEDEGNKRRYYYVMDLRGQLFLENTKRSIATSMKDNKFLDFMYKNLKPNDSGIAQHIPYLTLCGKEINFVTPIDGNSPMVFKDIVHNATNKTFKLVYGGTLVQDFNPALLAFCNETGRFYHELTDHKHLSNSGRNVYGLLHVNITTQYFSDYIEYDVDGSTEHLKLHWTDPSSGHSAVYNVKTI